MGFKPQAVVIILKSMPIEHPNSIPGTRMVEHTKSHYIYEADCVFVMAGNYHHLPDHVRLVPLSCVSSHSTSEKFLEGVKPQRSGIIMKPLGECRPLVGHHMWGDILAHKVLIQ